MFAVGRMSGPALTISDLSVAVSPAGATLNGPGTIEATDTQVTVTYATSTTSARFSVPVASGQRYRVTWTQTGTSGGQAGFGTSSGGTQYRGTINSTAGTTLDLTTTTTTLWISFQRASAGTTTFSNIRITPIDEVTWVDMSPNPISPLAANWTFSSGSATVNESTGDVTIVASGTNVSAYQLITTVTNKLYRLAWTNTNNSTMCLIAAGIGGPQTKTATSSDAIGARTFEFVAQGTQTLVQWQRSAAGTAIVTNPRIQETV